MPTVDIKADYGAAGDGQKVTATLTISSGSPNLASSTDLWASGDAGKKICVQGAGAAGAVLNTSILTFTDSKHVVLAANAGTALAAASKLVEWGTDDHTAWTNATNAFQGQAGVIWRVPAGRYCFNHGGSGARIGHGIAGLTIVAASRTGVILSDMLGVGSGFFLGSCLSGVVNDNAHSARAATAVRGVSAITLQDVSKASLFSVNSYALMTGFDLQGTGYPPNHQWSEYVYITGISGATLTIRDPLRNTYKSTWPLFNAGSGSGADQAGPATLYSLESGWDADHEYIDLNLEQSPQTNSPGRHVKFTRGSSSGFGIYPSRNDVFEAVDFDGSGMAAAECDKENRRVVINGGTWHGIDWQSSSTERLELTGAHITNIFNGLPRKAVLRGCTVDVEIAIGAKSFGSSELFYADACSFAGFTIGGVEEGDIFGVGSYSFSNGVFTRGTSAGTGVSPQWAVPRSWCFVSGIHANMYAFQVTDVTQSGGNISIATDLPSNIFSVLQANGGGEYAIRTHPAPRARFISCTGCDDAVAFSLAPTVMPLFSYWKNTYTTFASTTVAAVFRITGKITSIKINVTTPYTGTQGTLKLTFDGPFVIKSNGQRQVWDPQVNLKTAGLRTIALANVTGTQAGDTNLTVPDSVSTWLIPDQITLKASADISGENPSVWPTFSVEFITDQGLNNLGSSFICNFS